jgi:hypothetical protein
MSIFQLWWTGVTRPVKAFEELKMKPAPTWGFWVVLVFNLLISITTLLVQYLLRQPPFLESWLTFLPTENYRLVEMFFLPPLRILVWVLAAGVIHLVLRLVNKASNFDIILNIGGLGYLVIMPFVLFSDWLLIVLNTYWLAEYTHPLATLWGLILTIIGLKELVGTNTGLAIALAILSTAVSIPLLAIFAR